MAPSTYAGDTKEVDVVEFEGEKESDSVIMAWREPAKGGVKRSELDGGRKRDSARTGVAVEPDVLGGGEGGGGHGLRRNGRRR